MPLLSVGSLPRNRSLTSRPWRPHRATRESRRPLSAHPSWLEDLRCFDWPNLCPKPKRKKYPLTTQQQTLSRYGAEDPAKRWVKDDTGYQKSKASEVIWRLRWAGQSNSKCSWKSWGSWEALSTKPWQKYGTGEMEECHTWPHTSYFNSTRGFPKHQNSIRSSSHLFQQYSFDGATRLRRRTYDFAVNLGIHLTGWQWTKGDVTRWHHSQYQHQCTREANKLESQKGIMPPDHQMCMNPMRILWILFLLHHFISNSFLHHTHCSF